MKKIFISEIGNNHFGDKQRFKDLIKASRDSGATLVKAQLFDPERISGSMHSGFYKQCSAIFEHLAEFLEFSIEQDIPLFYSYFHKWPVHEAMQEYKKIAGIQAHDIFIHGINEKRFKIDDDNVFISLPKTITDFPFLKKSVVMHVSDYMTDKPNLIRLDSMSCYYDSIEGREKGLIGYSDHTLGIENCVKAMDSYGANIIEKHFTLKKDMKWNGATFRDTVHGATPKEFNELTRRYL